MKDVILINAGTGNLRSVQKALEVVGANVERTDDSNKVMSGRKIVLPGVGAFGDFMSGLRARGLEDAVKDVAKHGVPMLGICVGMQALFEVGYEMGEHAGLGLLEGKVTQFEKALSVKIPHTGWNQVEVRNEVSLFGGIDSGSYVYFNHSFYCQAKNSSDVIACANYGLSFACAVQRENIFGVQFHPEKSQTVGLQILKNFVELT
ncbi:MAG TPA: imidazole glycerol phosphate synthase subunit HisH [Anaerolineales bacterium]|nr:imidazole glycerol phosphate synthase subunit HisH [Anaerolineales bacterium]